MGHGIKVILSSVILVLLVACDESKFVSEGLSLNGVTVDSYLSGATVCIDLNKDGVCSATEVNTTTTQDGKFSFSDVNRSGNDYASLLTVGGTDSATNKVFYDELRTILNKQNILLDIVITPLTDLTAISFLSSPMQDSKALNNSRQIVADAFTIVPTDLDKDPMQNINLFLKVQELQYIKNLLQNITSISLGENAATYDKKYIFSEIKKMLLTQIQEGNWSTLDFYIVLAAMEIKFNVTIPSQAKDYLVSNIAQFRSMLTTIASDTRLKVEMLDRLQIFLEIIIGDQSIGALVSKQYNFQISSIEPDTFYSFITQTDFNTTDAIYDKRACLKNSIYNSIEDSSLIPSYVGDTENGIYINSLLPFDLNIEKTNMRLFYPLLKVKKINENTIFSANNYYIAFDQAWVFNNDRKVYIQTPKDSNGLHECYRLDLSSKITSELVATKVFRYSTL